MRAARFGSRVWLVGRTTLALASLSLSCGAADDSVESDRSAFVGPGAGWTVVNGPLGARVLVPPTEDASGITLELVGSFADVNATPAGPGWIIGPSGRTFRHPVIVDLPLHEGATVHRAGGHAGSPPRFSVYTKASTEEAWEELPGIAVPNSDHVLASVRHFSPLLPVVASADSAPTVNVTGTWTGLLNFTSNDRNFVVQLHQWTDGKPNTRGKILGYVLGGTASRTVVEGSVSADQLSLQLEMVDPLLTHTFDITATVSKPDTTVTNTFTGWAIHTITTNATHVKAPPSKVLVTWTSRSDVLYERRFVFAKGSSITNAQSPTDLAVVLDSAGALVAGGFSGRQDCNLLACQGGVTSFSEDVNLGLLIGLESAGDCVGSGMLTVPPFNTALRTYSGGDYNLSNCNFAHNGVGNLFGARGTRTRSDDVASSFVAYGRLAADLQKGTSFAAFLAPSPRYPPLASNYLNYGVNYAAELADLDNEVATYAPVEITFNRFTQFNTGGEAYVHPLLDSPISANFHERRVGTLACGVGNPTAVYEQTDLPDAIRFLTNQSGNWVIYGNHDSAEKDRLVLPFARNRFVARDAGIWPFGVHGGGHPEGHGGWDFDLLPDTPLVAAASGTITRITDDPAFPESKLIQIDAGSYLLQYGHVKSPLPAGIVQNLSVTKDVTVIGEVQHHCCDPLLSNCAAYPAVELCSVPGANESYAVHLGVEDTAGVVPFCEFAYLEPGAQTFSLAPSAEPRYRESLTEPFLCNDPHRQAPLQVLWVKTTNVNPTNPAKIRFARDDIADASAYSYDWLDSTHAGPMTRVLNGDRQTPDVIDMGAFHGVMKMTTQGATCSTLHLDVGTTGSRPVDMNGADSYTPTIEK